jgi:CheY-like chemotaxis protein
VTTAASGTEAIDRCRTDAFDAIVCDLAMPDGSGFDVAQFVRHDPRTASLPLIAITAYSRPEDRERARTEGFDEHVGKPFNPRALVAMVAGLTGR